MARKQKKGKAKGRGKEKEPVLLTEEERGALVRNIQLQLMGLQDPSPQVRWADMDSIKKLKVMLNLFAKHGKEFDTTLPLPQLQERYLEVRLRTVKNRPSTVVIRSGSI